MWFNLGSTPGWLCHLVIFVMYCSQPRAGGRRRGGEAWTDRPQHKSVLRNSPRFATQPFLPFSKQQKGKKQKWQPLYSHRNSLWALRNRGAGVRHGAGCQERYTGQTAIPTRTRQNQANIIRVVSPTTSKGGNYPVSYLCLGLFSLHAAESGFYTKGSYLVWIKNQQPTELKDSAH